MPTLTGPATPTPDPTTDPPAARPRTTGRRGTEVVVALLFVAATATFAASDALIPGAPASAAALQAGTGLAVLGTGLLLLPVLRPYAPRRALGYLLARALECLALFGCGAWLLATGSPVPSYALVVYGFSAVGGLLLAWALLDARLVPSWLAVAGLVGYASLLAGTTLDTLGLLTLDAGTGVLLLAPGAVFEVALPILLLARGFRR